AGEGKRPVEVREVPRLLEDREAAARHRLGGPVAVGYGDDPVALAPDDQRRDGVREVEAVAGADALAAVVDHRAGRAEEGGTGLGVGEGRVAAGDLGDVGARGEADRAE